MGKARQNPTIASNPRGNDSTRPLASLLSQVLVAFTVEFDNEFERRMGELGQPCRRLSLLVWSEVIRFIPEEGLTIQGLATQASKTPERLKAMLGCLERWAVVLLQSPAKTDRTVLIDAALPPRRNRRIGWGSGRGIRGDWTVHLTPVGLTARDVWPPLFGEIESRWNSRFGDQEIGRLRRHLEAVITSFDDELRQSQPQITPSSAGANRDASDLPLPTLLSESLRAFTIEFDRESPVPLSLCANALRVLGQTPVNVSDLPRLTGGSPEASGIGWQLKPYVVVEPDPSRQRGKIVRLSPLGLKVQQTYLRLLGEIERLWEQRLGTDQTQRLREALLTLFDRHGGKQPRIAQGLIPPQGVTRAGAQLPALGRRDIGPAARQRMRDLVIQTQAWIQDPAATLPHYPLWDMNRGFGP